MEKDISQYISCQWNDSFHPPPTKNTRNLFMLKWSLGALSIRFLIGFAKQFVARLSGQWINIGYEFAVGPLSMISGYDRDRGGGGGGDAA